MRGIGDLPNSTPDTPIGLALRASINVVGFIARKPSD